MFLPPTHLSYRLKGLKFVSINLLMNVESQIDSADGYKPGTGLPLHLLVC